MSSVVTFDSVFHWLATIVGTPATWNAHDRPIAPLASADGPARGFARGEDREVRVEMKIQDLPRLEEAVFVLRARQDDRRVHWQTVVHESVRREVQDPEVRRRALDESFLRGLADRDA
jgi:hypothetical protein